jgi:hypothetical protein
MSSEQSNILSSSISESTYVAFEESIWKDIPVGTYIRILLKNNTSTRGGRLVKIQYNQQDNTYEFSIKHHNCKTITIIHINDIQNIYQLKEDKKKEKSTVNEKAEKLELENNDKLIENKDNQVEETKTKKTTDIISVDNIKVIKYIIPRIEVLENKVKTIESNIQKIIDILKSNMK